MSCHSGSVLHPDLLSSSRITMMGKNPTVHPSREKQVPAARWVVSERGHQASTPGAHPWEVKTRGKEAWRDIGEGHTVSCTGAAPRRGLRQDWKRETSHQQERGGHACSQLLDRDLPIEFN